MFYTCSYNLSKHCVDFNQIQSLRTAVTTLILTLTITLLNPNLIHPMPTLLTLLNLIFNSVSYKHHGHHMLYRLELG